MKDDSTKHVTKSQWWWWLTWHWSPKSCKLTLWIYMQQLNVYQIQNGAQPK
jgi:hypothetical protein